MPKPYWSGDGIQLYLGDCREVLEWLKADVLVTDPPYGMGYQSGSRHQKHERIAGDGDETLRDSVLEMWGNKPGIVFGTWRAPRPAGTKVVAIWDKTDGVGPGMGDLNMPFGSSHEEFYLVGGPWKLHSKRRRSVIRTSMQMGGQGVVTAVGHPTAKPDSLLEVLVSSTDPKGVVADPFAGGGSTLVACRNLGRRAIGVELEERYCEIAARRLDQGVLDFGDVG